MKRIQKPKPKLRIISIIIVLTMLIGNIFGMGATMPSNENVSKIDGKLTAFTPIDPLEFMQDIPDNLYEQPFDEMYEQEPNDGNTDRYIVKYRSSGGKENFQSKLSSQIASSEEISVSVDRAKASDSRTSSENPSGNGDKSTLRTNQWEVLTLNEKILPSELAEEIRSRDALGDIEYIQPDYKLSLDSVDITGGKLTETDGDVLIDRKLGTPTDIYNRNAEVIVAVIDTGIDIYHDALADYVDAANMWDFTQNTNEIYSSSNPLESAHGTHIAGIIANTARENGVDNIKILPLKVFSNGFAYTSDIMAAIEYALEQGAAIVNCSFGSTQENPALAEIIANANALFVCAVGNNRRDFMETPSYPAGYDLPNVISVASVNADGGFSYFSNYGENIDITALGRDVWSTLPENEYGMLTGTSMSAGYVTAVAAIVSVNERLTAEELRYRLLATADMLSNLQGKVNQGKRVNLANAVNIIVQTDVIENYPEDDFDVHGYQMTESELFQLYSSTTVVQVVLRANHTLVLTSNGIVWAWGSNVNGQCGNGTVSHSELLVQVVGLNNITAISTGRDHSLALRNDGTVWAWGNNGSGRLGDGTNTRRTTPVQVTGLTGVTAISAGGYHSLALKNDGTVWAWGDNIDGRLGDGTTTLSTTPVQVPNVSGITAISAGYYHSMSLKNDGTVQAWGANWAGQLGDGTTTNRTTAVQVTGLADIITISAGEAHSIALMNDGTVRAWGRNSSGQLGDGTLTQRTTPVQVTGLGSMTAIAAGNLHNIALKSDGTVWAWGLNDNGRLGDGTTILRKIPVQVTGLSSVTTIAAGESHNMALKNDGTIWAWGANEHGKLGVQGITESPVPILIMYSSFLHASNITSSITRDITNNNEFIVMCSLNNITSFNGSTFEITYNPGQVTLVDFAAQTPVLNVNVGTVAETDLEILSHNTTTGILIFNVNKTVSTGSMWSGTVTILKFNANVTGTTTVYFDEIINNPFPKPTTKPLAPTDFEATLGTGGITFTWNDPNPVGAIDYYELSIARTGFGWSNEKYNGIPATKQIMNGNTYTLAQLGIIANGEYDFRIRAYNLAATTPQSTYAYMGADSGGRYKITINTISNPISKPLAPTDFEAVLGAGGITFTWNDPNPAGSINYYELSIALIGSGWSNEKDIGIPATKQIVNGNTYTLAQLGITVNGEYDFRIQAVNFAANTPKSTYAYIGADSGGRYRITISSF